MTLAVNSRPDAAGDQGFTTLYQLAQHFPLPEYVKQADPAETLNPEGLPSGAYALPAKQWFPCHTKAACYVSAMYLANNGDQLTKDDRARAEDLLTKSAARLGIASDLESIKEAQAAMTKASEDGLSDSDFALVWVGDDGTRNRQYPLRNAHEVKAAAVWFGKYRDEFMFNDRHVIANKLLDKVAQYNVPLSDEQEALLEKQAGRGTYDPGRVVEQLHARGRLVKEIRGHLEKMASTLLDDPLRAEDPSMTAKIAEVVDEVDRRFKLTGHYGKALERPEDFLFDGVFKFAQSFVDTTCPTITGSIYGNEQFGKLSVDAVRQNFGRKIAEAVTSGIRVDGEKMATVAATLPLPDAILLDRVMAAAGQRPIHVKASSAGPSDEERARLAKEYALANAGQPLDVTPTGLVGSHTIG